MKKITFLSIVLILFTYCSDNCVNPPEIPSDIPTDESPAWSPDGKWIAYWHYDPNGTDSTFTTGLYIIDTTGQERKRVIEGNAWNPDWSPDGRYMVFNHGRDIYQIEINSLVLTQITNVASAFFPNYSPDGTRIAFDQTTNYPTVPSDSSGIWVYYFKDATKIHLGLGRDPDWNSSGDKIVYVGPPGITNTETQIWKADTAGLTKIQLTSNDFVTNRYPAWSPDGLKIVWSVTAPDIYYSDIWIMNSDGTEQRRLTTGAYPSWSPDSKKLVFMKPLPDKSKGVLWIIDLQSMQIKQLTH